MPPFILYLIRKDAIHLHIFWWKEKEFVYFHNGYTAIERPTDEADCEEEKKAGRKNLIFIRVSQSPGPG